MASEEAVAASNPIRFRIWQSNPRPQIQATSITGNRSSPGEPQIPYAPIMKNLLFLLLCLATCVQAVDLRGRVVAVSDGDTVTVLDAERTFFHCARRYTSGLGEMRVGHVGHGDQEVLREVH